MQGTAGSLVEQRMASDHGPASKQETQTYDLGQLDSANHQRAMEEGPGLQMEQLRVVS